MAEQFEFNHDEYRNPVDAYLELRESGYQCPKCGHDDFFPRKLMNYYECEFVACCEQCETPVGKFKHANWYHYIIYNDIGR